MVIQLSAQGVTYPLEMSDADVKILHRDLNKFLRRKQRKHRDPMRQVEFAASFFRDKGFQVRTDGSLCFVI